MPQTTEDLAKALQALNVLDNLMPIARNAEALRSLGIRLALDTNAREALELLASEGNHAAALVRSASFPTGHIEVSIVK